MRRGGDLVEELLLQEAVVAVGVVKRHGALVDEENLPPVPGDIGGVDELLRGHVGGDGAAGDANFELVVARKGVGLGLEYVGVEVGLEGLCGGKSVEFGMSGTHGYCAL